MTTPQFWIAGGLSVCVVAFLLREVLWLIRAHASNGWPKIEGTIVRRNVERIEHAPKEYGTRVAGYYLHAAYEYHVAGTTYHSEILDCGRSTRRKVGPGLAAGATDAAENWYAQGDDVEVYHDPRNPSVAVLEPGVQPVMVRRVVLLLFAEAMIVAFGIVPLW